MKTPLRLGIAGLGTVGIGVVKIVQSHQGRRLRPLDDERGGRRLGLGL